MEYAIFYNTKTRSYAMQRYDCIKDITSVLRTFQCDSYIEAVQECKEIYEEIECLKKIPVVIIDSMEEPIFTSIYNKLHEFHRIVSSTIDIVNCCDLDDYDIICSDEGKNDLLPLNRALTKNHKVYDIVAGTMIITKSNDRGETVGLEPVDIDRIYNHFSYPEVYTITNDGNDITVIKISFELAKVMRMNYISNISIIDL